MNNNDIQQQTPPEEFNIENYPKEKYITGKGEEKERYIVPDDIFEEHLKELPNGTVNESKSYRAYCGGKLTILGADPERDKAIHKAGAEATNATLKQRRTFKEQIDIILSTKDKENGKTGLENVTIAMYERAIAGDTKAAQFLRDTAGEKPADNIDLNANVMTEADKQLMEKLKARLN
jgi:hypothetical protein